MSNNIYYRVMGKWLIRLKMLDGMIKELDDVKCVPELKRNLISLEMLDKLGYFVYFVSRTLKVTN